MLALKWAGNRNVIRVNSLPSNNWRTSPVPAPAVIPAPVTYFEVVAVKTLVAELGPLGGTRARRGCATQVVATGGPPPWAPTARGV